MRGCYCNRWATCRAGGRDLKMPARTAEKPGVGSGMRTVWSKTAGCLGLRSSLLHAVSAPGEATWYRPTVMAVKPAQAATINPIPRAQLQEQSARRINGTASPMAVLAQWHCQRNGTASATPSTTTTARERSLSHQRSNPRGRRGHLFRQDLLPIHVVQTSPVVFDTFVIRRHDPHVCPRPGTRLD